MWAFCRYAVIILLFIPVAAGFKVFPTATELGETYANEQSFILSIVNDGPTIEQVTMVVDPDGDYLESYVTIDEPEFIIKPNEKKNIRLTMAFPKNLSPEIHVYRITPMSERVMGESSEYSFYVDGIPRPDLRVGSVEFADIGFEQPLFLELNLENKGNVIARGYPQIEIIQNGTIVSTMQYQSRLRVMPFSTLDISLMHDTSDIPPGEYVVRMRMLYNDDLTTDDYERPLKIHEEEVREQSSFSLTPILMGIGIVLILVLVLVKFFKGQDQDTVRLMRRLHLAERELDSLVHQTDRFISESNKWLQKRGGFRFE